VLRVPQFGACTTVRSHVFDSVERLLVVKVRCNSELFNLLCRRQLCSELTLNDRSDIKFEVLLTKNKKIPAPCFFEAPAKIHLEYFSNF
jgi:hypothetical protein